MEPKSTQDPVFLLLQTISQKTERTTPGAHVRSTESDVAALRPRNTSRRTSDPARILPAPNFHWATSRFSFSLYRTRRACYTLPHYFAQFKNIDTPPTEHAMSGGGGEDDLGSSV